VERPKYTFGEHNQERTLENHTTVTTNNLFKIQSFVNEKLTFVFQTQPSQTPALPGAGLYPFIYASKHSFSISQKV
jgi:hypothetical protein